MKIKDRWEYIISLDEELLKGSVILSEWCALIVRETDVAFASGANLASILTAVAAIETYLKSEYSATGIEKLVELINISPIAEDLKVALHRLRMYRNKWVHVDDPSDDSRLLENPEETENELENMAFISARSLRRVIYENQCV